MRLPWKIVAAVACVVLICAGAALWLARRNANERKLADAARACRASAERGDANAQYNLGRMYAHGRGVPQDYDEAVVWYRKAADQGNAKAEDGLAWSYYYGYGVQQDYAEALRLYSKAADQGDAHGQYDLGSMYYYGRGVPQDYAQADRWYLKAARQGDIFAQDGLGYTYSYGLGVPQDNAEADRWYRKAADQGDEYAQRALGLRTSLTGFWYKGFLALIFIGSTLILTGNLSPIMRERKLERRISVLTGLLGLLYGALDLFAYSPYGVFPSLLTANTFQFCTRLIGGVFLGMAVSMVWQNCAKKLLAIAGILFALLNLFFIGFYLYAAVRHSAMPPLSRFRVFYVTEGNLIGLAISAAILYRLRSSRSEGSDDDGAVSEEPDEDATEGAGICAGND